MSEFEEMWSDRLVTWGYVVLTVDSFTPRGFENNCKEEMVTPWTRALDAYDASTDLTIW
jgi:dienelactone hydrolase